MSQRSETSAPGEPLPGRARTERVGIAGSGTVACGLAACVASGGYEVVMWARSPRSRERAREAMGALCEKLPEAKAVERVEVTVELSELSVATLAVEAVVEQEAVKRTVLAELGETLPGDSIIATATSSLRISALADACGRPSRFFGLHVFNPVHRMELVELCFPAGVNADVRSRAIGFCEAIGKTAVEVPDETGFVVNRLLFPFLFDAVRLLERTGMAPDQVDACMKLGASHPMGPLELLDLIGLDVADAIGDALHDATGDSAHRPPERIKRLVGEGSLGRKSGAGFYRYG